MTTYNYKVWYRTTENKNNVSMEVHCAEEMTRADIVNWCRLEDKVYLTHIKLPETQEITLTITFGAVAPITQMLSVLNALESELNDFEAVCAIKEALQNKIDELEVEDHVNRTCRCTKLRLSTTQLHRIVRVCSQFIYTEVEDLLTYLNGMCELHSELFISDYLHKHLSHLYNEEELETTATKIEEIINT